MVYLTLFWLLIKLVFLILLFIVLVANNLIIVLINSLSLHLLKDEYGYPTLLSVPLIYCKSLSFVDLVVLY
jgi:hypothetical protein